MVNFGKADRAIIKTLIEDYAGYETPFLAQHGISFLIEVNYGSKKKKILFDAGQSAAPIIQNMEVLGEKPEDIDLIFLSHCHYDHTGGVAELLEEMDNSNIPIIAHPEIFRPCFVLNPRRNIGMFGQNTKKNIEARGGRLDLKEKPSKLMPGVLSTGEIEKTVEFERKITINTYTHKDGKRSKDKVPDEISLLIRIKNLGLLIVSGCSHSGIINIIKHSKKLVENSGNVSVIGGFHLINAKEARIENTVECIRKLEVKKIFSGHCTGFKGEMKLKTELGERFEKLHSGKVIDTDNLKSSK